MAELSKDFYKAACDNVPYGLAAVGPDGNFVWVNYFFTLLTGYSEAELTEKTWMEITDIADIGPDALEVQRVLNGITDHYTLQKKYVQKSGKKIPVLLHVYKFPEKGDLALFLVFVGPNGSSDMYIKNLEEQIQALSSKLEHISTQIDNPGELMVRGIKSYWWLISGAATVIGAVVGWAINIIT